MPTDPVSLREWHEARARVLQREAMDAAARAAGAWLRRAIRSCLPHPAGPARLPVFTLHRRT